MSMVRRTSPGRKKKICSQVSSRIWWVVGTRRWARHSRIDEWQRTVKETFNLEEVPKEALYIGLAGVLPYMATSLSTVYLAYDINHAEVHGSGLLIDPANAEILLHIIEPLQVGYGAVVSFITLTSAT